MSKVLIVDDAAFMRMMIKDIVVKNNFTVIGEAENGKEAIVKYRELKPDLVTMNFIMPELDGISAIKQIKAFDPKALIIMCSAMGNQTTVIEAIQAGAIDFIVKPFTAERVIKALNEASALLATQKD